MIKIAVLDDYQNIFEQIIKIDDYKDKFDFQIFKKPFQDEIQTTEELKDFEVLFLMRERTPVTKSLINNLPKLKYIMTSGMRNKSIDIKFANSKNIIVCGLSLIHI